MESLVSPKFDSSRSIFSNRKRIASAKPIIDMKKVQMSQIKEKTIPIIKQSISYEREKRLGTAVNIRRR